MALIEWLSVFESIDIEKKIKSQAYKINTIEEKKNYYSEASFQVTLQYLKKFKEETNLLSISRKIDYIEALNLPLPKVGKSDSPVFNQTVYEAQSNFYEFLTLYKNKITERKEESEELKQSTEQKKNPTYGAYALYFHYLQASQDHAYFEEATGGKLQAIKNICKEYGLRSPKYFQTEYNKLHVSNADRIAANQIMNIESAIELLGDYPKAVAIAQNELKTAQSKK